MTTKSAIFALPITDLGLSHGAVRWIRKLIQESTPEAASKDPLLVEDAIAAYMARAEKRVDDGHFYHQKKLPSEIRFLKRLVKLGLTRFDFICLSQKTVSARAQRRISKEGWLNKPVLLLGTMPAATILEFAPGREHAHQVLVRHLLGTIERPGWRLRHYRKSMRKTRALLTKLGFTYEDGGIMSFGTLRQRAETLAAKHNLKLRTAIKIARIASKEGWVRID